MKIIVIIVFALLAGSVFAQDQIQNQPNQPQDGFQGWFPQQSGITGNLGHVFFKNRDTGWATSGYTFSIWTTDGGGTWQKYSDSIAVRGFIGSFGYGTTILGSNWIVVTTDNGQTWKSYDTHIGAVSNLYFPTPSKGFFGNGGSIIKTNDGGKSWIRDTTIVGKVNAFSFLDTLTGFAVGSDLNENTHSIQSLFLTTNGGMTWHYTPRVHYINGGFNCGAFLSREISVFVGSSLFSFISGDFGYSLDTIHFPDAPERHALFGISSSDKNNATIVGEHGKIYRSYDAGEHWEIQNSGTPNTLQSVIFLDSATGWAVGDGGVILHTTNAGFSLVQSQLPDSLNTQIFPDPATTTLTLGITLPIPQHVSVAILDIAGNQVLTPFSNTMGSLGSQSFPIDIHALPSGAYMLLVQTERYSSLTKFSVVR